MIVRLNKKRWLKYGSLLLVLFTFILISANSLFSAPNYRKEDSPMHKITQSPQYEKGRFKGVSMEMPPLYQTMKKQFFGDEIRKPDQELPQENMDIQRFHNRSEQNIWLSNFGHSSLFLNVEGLRILTDPVFERKISIVGPTRFHQTLPLDIHQLDSIDYVLISHNHYDHLNKFSIQFLSDRTKHFFVPLGVGALLESWGVPRDKITELDWWEEVELENITLAATPSQHFSGRGLTDRNKSLWASYVIMTDRHRLYFSGDTGYFDGFTNIGEKYGPFDIAFMECGAYNEAWANVHMFPEESVQGAIDLQAKNIYPIHWGTFNLSLHDWFDPMERAKREATSRGLPIITPVFGASVSYPDQILFADWWTPYLPEPAEALAFSK